MDEEDTSGTSGRAYASTFSAASGGEDGNSRMAGRGLGDNQAVPGFLSKTFEIMNTPEFQSVVRWGADGDSIQILDEAVFSERVLPQYFKHSNFQSFVRQLNMYSFSKTRHDSTWREFRHPYFKRNRADLLVLIKRKTNTSTQAYISKSQASAAAAAAMAVADYGTGSSTAAADQQHGSTAEPMQRVEDALVLPNTAAFPQLIGAGGLGSGGAMQPQSTSASPAASPKPFPWIPVGGSMLPGLPDIGVADSMSSTLPALSELLNRQIIEHLRTHAQQPRQQPRQRSSGPGGNTPSLASSSSLEERAIGAGSAAAAGRVLPSPHGNGFSSSSSSSSSPAASSSLGIAAHHQAPSATAPSLQLPTAAVASSSSSSSSSSAGPGSALAGPSCAVNHASSLPPAAGAASLSSGATIAIGSSLSLAAASPMDGNRAGSWGQWAAGSAASAATPSQFTGPPALPPVHLPPQSSAFFPSAPSAQAALAPGPGALTPGPGAHAPNGPGVPTLNRASAGLRLHSHVGMGLGPRAYGGGAQLSNPPSNVMPTITVPASALVGYESNIRMVAREVDTLKARVKSLEEHLARAEMHMIRVRTENDALYGLFDAAEPGFLAQVREQVGAAMGRPRHALAGDSAAAASRRASPGGDGHAGKTRGTSRGRGRGRGRPRGKRQTFSRGRGGLHGSGGGDEGEEEGDEDYCEPPSSGGRRTVGKKAGRPSGATHHRDDEAEYGGGEGYGEGEEGEEEQRDGFGGFEEEDELRGDAYYEQQYDGDERRGDGGDAGEGEAGEEVPYGRGRRTQMRRTADRAGAVAAAGVLLSTSSGSGARQLQRPRGSGGVAEASSAAGGAGHSSSGADHEGLGALLSAALHAPRSDTGPTGLASSGAGALPEPPALLEESASSAAAGAESYAGLGAAAAVAVVTGAAGKLVQELEGSVVAAGAGALPDASEAVVGILL